MNFGTIASNQNAKKKAQLFYMDTDGFKVYIKT